jgi:hypothetical protein
MAKIVYDPSKDRKTKSGNPSDSKAINEKIRNNQVKVKGKAKREKEVEKRKIIIHGREHWLSKAELPKELGCTPEEAENIWRAAAEPEKPKARGGLTFTDEQFIAVLRGIGKPATSREVSDKLGIGDPEVGRQMVRTRMAKLIAEKKVVAVKPEKGRAKQLYKLA